jgi:ABC-type nitrate/sulfonate/bicarbonate transport system ATPase subunit
MTAGAEITGLTKSFRVADRVVSVFDALDFSQRDGITVVLGASGCGKTTLLRLIAGMATPDAGTIAIRGTGSVGMVFQEPRLMPWLTTVQNIRFGLGRGARDTQRLVELTGLTGFEKALPHQLSGGMQHRVALARALANHSALVLMDEPFAALDHLTRERMQDELLALQRAEGMNVLFVTHSIDEALYLGDRIVVLTNGRIDADHDIAHVPGQHSRAPDPELTHLIRSTIQGNSPC